MRSPEWYRIFNSRDDEIRYAKGTVAGKEGVMVFPDGYSHPAGVSALASLNTPGAAFTSNQYSAADWFLMEAAGAIFLPAAGVRNITSVVMARGDLGMYGNYWAANTGSLGAAYEAYFDASQVNFSYTAKKFFGYAVRLVRN